MKNFFILFIVFFSIESKAGNKSFYSLNTNVQDTVIVPDSTNVVIDEVIKSTAIPKAEKVQYVSQVTKYGFKDLFKNFSYNSSMPYSSQVNPYAENYMQDYLQSHTAYLQKLKSTSKLYFDFIDNILTQYGLPKELKYLAVIESDLKPEALSWVGAKGPWQFMIYTARDYGLSVNENIDERTDYYKSTNAAARYLLSLYKDLKDWLLVIAAYNGGTGRVYSAIKKSGSRNFWNLQYYLPTESRNHVKKFIATHYVMEAVNSGSTGFDYTTLSASNDSSSIQSDLSEEEKNNTNVLTVSGKYNSTVVAKNLAIDIAEFKRLNPGFDAMLASGSNYALRLTPDKMDLFVANKYIILNECVQLLLNDVNTPTKTTYTKHSNSSSKRK